MIYPCKRDDTGGILVEPLEPEVKLFDLVARDCTKCTIITKFTTIVDDECTTKQKEAIIFNSRVTLNWLLYLRNCSIVMCLIDTGDAALDDQSTQINAMDKNLCSERTS